MEGDGDSPDTRQTRVLLAMRWELVRRGICQALEQATASFPTPAKVVGEATTYEQLLNLAATLRPDVVIGRANLFGLPAGEFLEGLSKACMANARVVVLVRSLRPDRVIEAMRTGIAGYLPIEIAPRDLGVAICAIRAGNTVFSEEARRLVGCSLGKPSGGHSLHALVDLTPREKEVLELVVRGLSNKEIAYELQVGRRTAEMHVAHLMDKLGVRSRSALLVALYRGADSLSLGQTATGSSVRVPD